MLEKLLIALIIIEIINITYNVSRGVMDIIITRNMTKSQKKAVEGQQYSIKLQEEQLKLNKAYSEKQDEQNENIKLLAHRITFLESRISAIELDRKPKPKKTTKKEGETK